MRRAPDAGFTLIETLVALAILAMSAMALLGATEAHIRTIAALESRAAAQWVAENYLAELAVGADPDAEPAPMLGVSLSVTETRSPTSDPDLEQVDLAATDRADGRVYARLTGFVMRGADR
ncbi:type II secretion system protein GspI [Paracoccus liaowanqingii]|uniref:Type II secretion system protein I n=1 Tax=Paracoccus liaowanqingii TaxID=2560053 RepID=A0A4Z1CQW2_9RHOB|nr:type II secretion system minor pseudopilin GspI [Paracoccus liaowanqingii]QDA36480.1 type II secretion system protein GspI [Paracoccus liaowanqingii]TGN67556.1 type II secretion system protein GspI [Paracoccus liaowanqingii]